MADDVAVDNPLTPSERAQLQNDWVQQRLSLPIALRLPLYLSISSITGFGLGLRFRAENAHRLPTTQAGWYLYHKSKNYVSLLGGLKEGFRMGGRLALWTGLFAGMEQGIDRFRSVAHRTFLTPLDEPLPPRGTPGREAERRRRVQERRKLEAARERSNDFVSTTFAGLGTAGVFSLVNGFPLPTFRRIAVMGLKAGFAFGLLQDAVSMMRGRRLGYVEWIKDRIGRGDSENAATIDEKAG